MEDLGAAADRVETDPEPMAEQTSNRFLVRGKSQRVAVIATASFPDPSQRFAYELSRRLCDHLGAEMCVAASTPAAPARWDADTKAWIEHGLFSPPSELVHATDLAHFSRTRPEAVERLVDELAQALGIGRDQVRNLPDVMLGGSMARWLQAWAPDLLVSFHGYAGSLWAHTAARLLDLPRVWITYAAEPDRPADLLLNSLHGRHADLVVTRSREIRHGLGRGDADGWLDMDMEDWELQTSRRLATMLASRAAAATRKDLGPSAAFPRADQPRPTRTGITPFVVLGSERAGSNQLVELLATHPRAHVSGELFNTQQIADGNLDLVLPNGASTADLIELRKNDPAAFLDRLLQTVAAGGFAAAGFKVLYHHGLAVDHLVAHLQAMPSLRIVHLVRDKALDCWSASTGPRQEPSPAVDLEPHETTACPEFDRQLVALFRALFAGHRTLELGYDQLALDPEAQRVPVQTFLGLEPRPFVRNRFLVRGKRLRVAAFATAAFPEPAQTFAYELVQKLCNRLDAEMCVAASAPADPTRCDASAKAWLERGLFSPPSDLVHATDLAHFRRTRPEAVDRLFDELAQALGTEPAQVAEIPDVKMGLSLARWLEVWAPDLLVSFYGFAGSLWAHTAARLLSLPRVWITYSAEPDRPAELMTNSLHCRHADLVVTSDREVRRGLGGDDAEGWLDMQTENWELQLSRKVCAVLATRTPAGARTDLGLKAAFPASTTRRSTPTGITPFVVLGSERTGSNLLIEMLLTHPDAFASGELFNTRQIEEGKLDVVLPKGTSAAELIELRKSDPPAVFDRILLAAAGLGRSAGGFKLLYYHGLAVDHVVEYLLAMPSLRVVHLVREDALARWISQARAERSDRWWSATERPSHQPPRVIELEPRETLLRLEQNRQLEDLFRALFAGQPWLERSYEQLASDLDTQTVPVQQFLGLEPRPLVAASKKTGVEDPRLLVSNWEQLVAAFADTRWRGLFPPR